MPARIVISTEQKRNLYTEAKNKKEDLENEKEYLPKIQFVIRTYNHSCSLRLDYAACCFRRRNHHGFSSRLNRRSKSSGGFMDINSRYSIEAQVYMQNEESTVICGSSTGIASNGSGYETISFKAEGNITIE